MSAFTESSEIPPHEIAYYYPEWHWRADEHAWVKSLLLFFDEIALLVPKYKRGDPGLLDPVLAGVLEDQGLLRILEPEWFVDAKMTIALGAGIDALLDQGAFNDLRLVAEWPTLSSARAGFRAVPDLANRLVQILEDRGLARPSEDDGLSIPMHPDVRLAYLVILAQSARRAGRRHGLDLHPASNHRGMHDAIVGMLGHRVSSLDQVIDFDMQTVSVNLDGVPLDEVLDFRDTHREEHRRYMANLRLFLRDITEYEDTTERTRALADRRAELHDAAEMLKSRAWRSFRRPKTAGAFALGLIGGAVALATRDVIPGVAAIGAQLLNLFPDPAEGSVYSYLFSIRDEM